MFITAKLKREDGSIIAEIPSVDGVTFCSEDEDISEYVSDYLDAMGVVVKVRFEGKNTLIITPNEPTQLIAAMLKRLRGSRSLAEVSHGIARTTLHQYEKGKRDPSLTTFTKLLCSLGFDFEIKLKSNLPSNH